MRVRTEGGFTRPCGAIFFRCGGLFESPHLIDAAVRLSVRTDGPELRLAVEWTRVLQSSSGKGISDYVVC